ncbi:MAG: single-stranded-DNA-specific exonuclease RecJ [Candidatus Riflebacteria bacterium]|nr:single-stranded-DNA-specific exonuclease RecJ [Candidatus Riflebacteria bacterium]
MNRLWTITSPPADEIERLRIQTNFSDLLIKILWNRGLKDKSVITRFLHPKSRYLGSPFLLSGIFRAVDCILKAITDNKRIRIYGDRDVDGITSTVLLLETIRLFTRKVDFTVPVIEDGYGLNKHYIETAAREGVNLIVTVDCGISNSNEIAFAKSLGIDVVVTDHHEPPSQLPDAAALIDPKLPGSDYPNKELAGVGVALKLSMALVLATSSSLTAPLIAFDVENDEINAIRFSPREGFSPQKTLNAQHIANTSLLFWDEKECETVKTLLPKGTRIKQQIILSELRKKFTPENSSLSKTEICEELNVPHDFNKVKSLLLMYLKYLEAIETRVKDLWHRSLDVMTIGTIADMVPLKGENRTISQLGLSFITKTRRIGLKQLFTLLGWKGKQITERDVSFSIAPILNSSGRLKSAELAIDLLSTDFPLKAKTLATELYNLNGERKRLAETTYKTVREHLFLQNDLIADKILLVNAPINNQGVTGIVATRLMLDFCRPVLVLLKDHEKFLGSARSYKTINIISALNSCSDLLEKYGGHVGAAGLTVIPENIDKLRERLKKYALENITDSELSSEWKIDADISLDDISDTLMTEIRRFAPFGVENPPPLFVCRKAHFYEVKKVGENRNHLRFKFKKSSGQPIYGIGFNLGRFTDTEIITNGICDMVFSLEINEYNGVKSQQIVVQDIVFFDSETLIPIPQEEKTFSIGIRGY